MLIATLTFPKDGRLKDIKRLVTGENDRWRTMTQWGPPPLNLKMQFHSNHIISKMGNKREDKVVHGCEYWQLEEM